MRAMASLKREYFVAFHLLCVDFCSYSFAFSRVVMDYVPGDSAEGGDGLRGICYIERGTSGNEGGCLTLVKQLIDARQTIV